MAHALLSPSSASRWLACTPSARLEQSFPDTSGEAAREGTLAHAIGENILRMYFSDSYPEKLLEERKALENDPLFTNDMLNHAHAYASYVIEQFEEIKKRTKDAVLMIEAKLDLTEHVPEGFGTGDAVIIGDGILHIIDLKYGKGVPVSCVNNKQMKLYALGAVTAYDYMYDLREIRMTIYQPRLDNISTDQILLEDLLTWAMDELKPKAKMAFQGIGEFVAGDHCRFCKAKAQCRELADHNLEVAKYDFKDSALLTPDEIADILTRADDFTKWISTVEDYALKAAIEQGIKFPGFKLVEGRSNRTYSDSQAVADTLIANNYPEEKIYVKQLLGITAMEKVLTKKVFDALLSPLVIKPAGKPTLVPESDKRPAWSSNESAANDFSE